MNIRKVKNKSYNTVITENNNIEYWHCTKRKKLLHRLDGPAVERASGENLWYRHGKLHRGGGLPARIQPNGFKAWFVNGFRHRTKGPAVVYGDDPWSRREWWWRGLLHREDGPAIIEPGSREYWYCYGVRHRIDGPAFQFTSRFENEWYVNDVNITDEIEPWLRRNKFTLPLSAEAQTLFVLTFVSKYGVPQKPTERFRY